MHVQTCKGPPSLKLKLHGKSKAVLSENITTTLFLKTYYPAENRLYRLTAICNETFDSIERDLEHRMHSLLPFRGPSRNALKYNAGRFVIPTDKTNRLKNSFIIRSCTSIMHICRFLVFFYQ